MPFGIFVFVIFLILKLTGAVAWSWLWVTSPLWIGLALTVVFWLFSLLFMGAAMSAVGTGHIVRQRQVRRQVQRGGRGSTNVQVGGNVYRNGRKVR